MEPRKHPRNSRVAGMEPLQPVKVELTNRCRASRAVPVSSLARVRSRTRRSSTSGIPRCRCACPPRSLPPLECVANELGFCATRRTQGSLPGGGRGLPLAVGEGDNGRERNTSPPRTGPPAPPPAAAAPPPPPCAKSAAARGSPGSSAEKSSKFAVTSLSAAAKAGSLYSGRGGGVAESRRGSGWGGRPSPLAAC